MVESFSGPVGVSETPDVTMVSAPPTSVGGSERQKPKKRGRESGAEASPAKPPCKTSRANKSKSPSLVIKKRTLAPNKTKMKKISVSSSASPTLSENTATITTVSSSTPVHLVTAIRWWGRSPVLAVVLVLSL